MPKAAPPSDPPPSPPCPDADPVKAFFCSEGKGHQWWQSLNKNRSDRAKLRRCRTLDAVTLSAPFHRLRFSAREAKLKVSDSSLAVIAGLLAHIDTDRPGSSDLAELMAGTGEQSRARISGLRFRRLLAIRDPDELLYKLARFIRQLDRAAPIASLAADIARWRLPHSGDRVRRDWAKSYYSAALQSGLNEP